VALESLAQLTPGDYVVHMDHGIGRFRGLERIRVDGLELEALSIEYAEDEVLRVPVYRLDLVERWVGEGAVGVRLGERLRAVPALEQERLARRALREALPQIADLAREHERRL
jgi:transcription-repair coupling factor (superfamily II helicase)